MALVKDSLKTAILNICNSARSNPMTDETFSDLIATAVDNHIKTATVTVNVVVASGSSAGTWPGTGSLS